MAEKTRLIETDTELGNKIVTVHNRFRDVTITTQDKDGKAIVVEGKSIYPEVFTDDLVLANLNEKEMTFVLVGLEYYFAMVNYADSFNHDLYEPIKMLANQINSVIISSRGRRMEAGKLAKTQYQFQESKYKESQDLPKKKGFLEKALGIGG